MIRYVRGDILAADVEALVNTVNCVGVMGRGIALQFKKAFPQNFKEYEAACKRGDVEPGRMMIHATGQITNPRYIINFPTKRHWKGNSRLSDIDSGLKDLAATIQRLGLGSIAVPPLGCGLGGLDWEVVRPRIEAALSQVPDVDSLIFEPEEVSSAKRIAKTASTPCMTSGRAALLSLMRCYLTGLMDPFISLLEIHKLMYFMQEADEPLALRFVKGPFGPYAENLRHVLIAMDGNFISGYAEGGDQPNKPLSLNNDAARAAAEFLTDYPDTKARLDRVSDLVQGFETPFGLELLATVHWVVRHEQPHATVEDVIRGVYTWNERKRQFSERQIRLVWDTLADKCWFN